MRQKKKKLRSRWEERREVRGKKVKREEAVQEAGLEEVDDSVGGAEEIGEGEKGAKTTKSKKKARSSWEERRGMKRGGGKAISTRTSRTVV